MEIKIIKAIAIALVFVIGMIMIVDRFTRAVITAEDKALIIEAETKAYLEKQTLCHELGGEFQEDYDNCIGA